MTEEVQKIRVGIGILIFKDGKVLLGKRKGSHGLGEYAPPGGHLEYMESFEECARREVMEECGLKIKNIKFLNVANVIEYSPKHYINLEFTADWESGEPQVLEPDKIDSWFWYSVDQIPEPIFVFVEQGIKSLKTGQNYFDIEK